MTAPGFVRHFIACNRHNPDDFVPFLIEGKAYGHIVKPLAARLTADMPHIFEANPLSGGVALSPRYDRFDTRSAALQEAAQALAKLYGKNLRDELYAVTRFWGDEPVAQIDRAAVPWYGVHAWGVHVNGYVRKPDGLYLWIGKRADDRPMDPGKLDCIIGGGMPFGLGIRENMRKEAYEEAGFKPQIADTARLIGSIDYRLDHHGHMRDDTLFVFDLELPEDLPPRNTDGEVAEFRLLPAAEVARLVRDTDQFKFNCNMIIADFLVRHGVLGEAEPDYAELMRWLAKLRAPAPASEAA